MVYKFFVFYLFYDLFLFLCFCLTYWGNFINYFISNQISCGFSYSSFRCSLCSIYSCFCWSVHWFFTIFIINFFANDKKPYFSTYFLSFGSIEYLIYNIYPIIRVILTLYSTSSCLLFCSINCTSINQNSVFVIFSIVSEWRNILINWPFGKKVSNTLDVFW